MREEGRKRVRKVGETKYEGSMKGGLVYGVELEMRVKRRKGTEGNEGRN